MGHKHTAPEDSVEGEMLTVPAGCIWQGSKHKEELKTPIISFTRRKEKGTLSQPERFQRSKGKDKLGNTLDNKG